MKLQPEDAVLRQLSGEDAESLAEFHCSDFRRPWTSEIQWTIRNYLASAIDLGAVSAVGLWVGEILVAVAVWRLDDGIPPRCWSEIVAVQTGYIRCGLGRRLKKFVIEEGRRAGAEAVLSHVHWDNEAMIALNASLGANIETIPGDYEHCLAVIPL